MYNSDYKLDRLRIWPSKRVQYTLCTKLYKYKFVGNLKDEKKRLEKDVQMYIYSIYLRCTSEWGQN